MRQIIGYQNARMIGIRVKPRWLASATAVSLVANGGTGQVILSIPLATIETWRDLDQAVHRVIKTGYSVADFMTALDEGFKLRHGKPVKAVLHS
jgi:hypothetical protein